MSGNFKPTTLGFNVWDHTIPEIYGILLGMFSKLGLIECLNISESELLDFIIDVDRGYLATFYHSFYHAADVTAVLYHMLLEMKASQYLSKPDMAAVLLAGLCHDIGHPGLNNLFQVNAKTELVKQFGETSVLEKYSCSLAMDLVTKHRLFRNIEHSPEATLPEGNRASEASMRDAMLKAIMATDMTFHYDMLNNLNILIEITSSPSSSPSNSDNESITTTTTTVDDDEEDDDASDSDSSDVNIFPSSPSRSLRSNDDEDDDEDDAIESELRLRALRERFACPVSHDNNQHQHLHRHRHHRRQSSSSSTASNSSLASMCSEGSTQTAHSMSTISMMGDESMTNMTTETSSGTAVDTNARGIIHNSASRSPSDLTPELRQSFLNCLLHAADISNAIKPWELCKHWSGLVIEEFFRQGDIEKAQNLPVSPNMDRMLHHQPQISLGFSDFVVRPYFESFVELLPEAAPYLVSLSKNRELWVSQKEALLEEEERKHRETMPQGGNGQATTAIYEEPSEAVEDGEQIVPGGTACDVADALQNAVPSRHRAGEELWRSGSPLPCYLTSGRRVSVAAGVLIVDETRPQRPPLHRRLRHSTTNAEVTPPSSSGNNHHHHHHHHHHHTIRKLKRSLSGRALSSSLRDLQVHPRPGSQHSILGTNVATVVSPDPAVSALKREVALVGQEAVVSLPGDSNSASPGSSTQVDAIQSAHNTNVDIKGLTQADKLQADEENAPRSRTPERRALVRNPLSTSMLRPPPNISVIDRHAPSTAMFRQRRHCSLQYGYNYPSIRHEFGDGYVILNHHDEQGPGTVLRRQDSNEPTAADGPNTTGPANPKTAARTFMPSDPLYACQAFGTLLHSSSSCCTSVAGSTASSSSSSSFSGASFGPGIEPLEEEVFSPPVFPVPNRHLQTGVRAGGGVRSSTPVVLTSQILYDWNIPPPENQQQLPQPQKAAMPAMASYGPLDDCEGITPLGHPTQEYQQQELNAPVVVLEGEDGQLSCVVGTSAVNSTAAADMTKCQEGNKSGKDGMILPHSHSDGFDKNASTLSISTASAGSSTTV
ncbi:High affinity cAMP-specific and IBMX-insensitive 3',5'-cyclic phosphodiesterase 9A [Dissophora globulifera]|uniref:Phosphodiesterase n=1 Tax=Dissophora globulifera TaxID=979702 RepID=A0A9P6RCA9_9FUNG|nr:High affinity cAMP-specific and IBMX-insensitive 3',5'-cyclic phosphodiesterase 9A [Dissophora globulifera]